MYSSVSHVRELAVTPPSCPPQRSGTTLGGMRILAGLCSLVLLLAPAARPVFADEVVVDDAAPTVQISGEWATSTVSGGFIGSGYRYRVAGDGSSSVTWLLPASASAGTYEVFARWTSGPNRASNATYVVTHAAGTASITVDQRSKGGDWQSLGSFGVPFDQLRFVIFFSLWFFLGVQIIFSSFFISMLGISRGTYIGDYDIKKH